MKEKKRIKKIQKKTFAAKTFIEQYNETNKTSEIFMIFMIIIRFTKKISLSCMFSVEKFISDTNNGKKWIYCNRFSFKLLFERSI